MTLRFALLLTSLLAFTATQAEIFKCERADGSIEFRATRCPIESSETEFTKSGLRTEHTREAASETEQETAPADAEPETKPVLSPETGSAFADLCRQQIARLEKMKALGPTGENATMSRVEFDEFVKGFEAQVEESCAQFL